MKGKAVLLPRDGAMIIQRAIAASAAGAKALVLYGDGGVPEGALGLNDRVKLPVVVIPGEQGAVAAGTLLTGGAVTVTFGTAQADNNPATGSIAAFSSTGLAFDDSVKPDLVAPGVGITSSSPGGGYTAQSGTSVAAAQVAGAAALVRRHTPSGARGSCAEPSSALPARCATRRRRRRAGRGAGRRQRRCGGGQRRGGRRRAGLALVRAGARPGRQRQARADAREPGKSTVTVAVSLPATAATTGPACRSRVRPRR